ncbi:MAG: hypothetical protein WAV56_03455 [Microgenomates group bacterium]
MKYKAVFDSDYNVSQFIKQFWQKKYPDFGKSYEARLSNKFPPETVNAFINAKSEVEVISIYREHLVKNRIVELGPIIAAGVEKILNEKSNFITSRLEEVYGKKVPFKSVEVRITYSLGNPFNPGRKVWHSTSYTFSPEKHIMASLHELNHVMFYRLEYKQVKKKYKINEKWIGLIKEGLTYLSDPEAHDDRPQVEYFREFMLSQRGKPIEEIIDTTIKQGIGKDL